MTNFRWIIIGALSIAISAVGPAMAAAAEPVDYQRDIQPLLMQHCYVCHGPSKTESGLRVDLRNRFFQGGDIGPIIASGHSEQSLLIEYVSGKNKDGIVMPPAGKAPPLSSAEIDLLKSWIDQGAPWPETAGGGTAGDPAGKTKLSDHWAYQPLRHVKPPASRDPWIDTPLDAFILARLQEHRLTPNSRAARLDLIRRVTLDLIGLPPTPEEVQQFIADKSDEAYEHLVDRLLASPHYGEQWARHWLDLARYADSDGFENDTDRPNAYKYRDYVIRSFNDDKPYDQFIIEQLAGDELDPSNANDLIATGFCRNGPTIGNQINEKNRVDEIDDMTSTTGAVFLGMTVGCARCHDHKYEPITQRDYYRLFSVFDNVQKSNDQEIMSLRDSNEKPRTTHVMLGGDCMRLGEEVQPGVPAVVENERAHFPLAGVAGRRLALARWIADAENPLTARVLVNRLWLYHFGRGLVNSPSNFGPSGEAPTHPELLDYLAGELVRGGWRLKAVQKQIVMSAAYRQSSAYDAIKSGADGDDQWYWRFPLRRLEAEAIRDSILSASGRLNPQMYGPGIKPKIPDDVIASTSKEMWPKVDRDGPAEWRRSVYIFVKRSVLVPMLEGFDAPAATQTCERRMTTTVATQALQLLNDQFSNEQAGYLAARIIHETGDETARQVDRAYWLTLLRPPTESQRQQAVQFVNQRFEIFRQQMLNAHHSFTAADEGQLHRRALADLCHVLFNCNEFVYLN